MIKILFVFVLSLLTAILLFSDTYLGLGFIFFLCFFYLAARYSKKLFIFWIILFPIFSTLRLSLGPFPDISFDRLIIPSLMLIVLSRNLIEKKHETSGKLFLLLSSFLIIASYSSLRSFTPIPALNKVFDAYVMPILLFYIGVYLFSRELNISSMLWIFLFLGSYISVMGIIEYVTHYDLFPSPIGLRGTPFFIRSNGPFSTTETYALFIGLCFFISLYIKHIRKNSWSFIELASMILMIIGMLCSMLRVIIVSFIVAFSFPFLYYTKKRLRFVFFIIFVFIICIYLYPITVNSPIFKERIANYKTIANRFSAYLSALEIIRHNPIQGIGFFNFSIVSSEYEYNILFKGYDRPSFVHNVFLDILAEMGLLGFIPFCGVIIAILLSFIRCVRINLHGDMTVISILIIFMLPFLSNNLTQAPQTNFLFLFLVSYLYTSEKILRKQEIFKNGDKGNILLNE